MVNARDDQIEFVAGEPELVGIVFDHKQVERCALDIDGELYRANLNIVNCDILIVHDCFDNRIDRRDRVCACFRAYTQGGLPGVGVVHEGNAVNHSVQEKMIFVASPGVEEGADIVEHTLQVVRD